MSAHEEWVTARTKAWMDTQRITVKSALNYIERENTKAGNWENGRELIDEDIEYLADLLEKHARRYLDPNDNSIQSDFISDCLSEVDWADIAIDYLQELVRES